VKDEKERLAQVLFFFAFPERDIRVQPYRRSLISVYGDLKVHVHTVSGGNITQWEPGVSFSQSKFSLF